MNSFRLVLWAILFLSISCKGDIETILSIETSTFKISLNNQGIFTEFMDQQRNINYIDEDSISALLSLRTSGNYLLPSLASVDKNKIKLIFPGDYEAIVQFTEQDRYTTFELLSLSQPEAFDLIVWGPFFTTIKSTIGETVGVVRNDEFAIGIQSLNIQTLGGYPWNESDRMPAFNFTSQEDPNNMHPQADGSVLYRIEAAKPTSNGSSLQAYSRNRSMPRIISDFRHDSIVAPPYNDGAPLGSKIAIFGVQKEDVLNTLGQIEVSEGLPHPMINGKWGKQSPEASAAYIITDFTEENIEDAIAITKQAGLKYMYHYGKTFENWGHFELYAGEFPDGVESLKRCVERAKAEGIMLGTHFLSNFITTNDPYVSPVPDQRLAKVGSSELTKPISASTNEIEIRSPNFFNQMENNSLKTVMIGEELIRYGSVSSASPWVLKDCQRGAFGTNAKGHSEGESISKLLDHAYKVFLTETDLTIELSERMAKLYNQTGLRQISFDGLEGNRSTGLGTYGESLMPYVWYNNLEKGLKEHLIIDASRTTHFFWHIYTRMNWGEPWYGGFRESQTEYRFKNQEYFQRNYMPGMLGWFKMTPETSLEDIDWLLARSAAYDAGYAFVANKDAFEQNGNTDGILERIGRWEKLRIGGAFSDGQKERMKNADREYQLTKMDKDWLLTEIQTEVLRHKPKVRQPGEPLFTAMEFSNQGDDQVLNFILSAEKTNASNIIIEIDNFKKVEIPISMKKGQKLKYEGGKKATLFNDTWKPVQSIILDANALKVANGNIKVSLDCIFNDYDEDSFLKLEVRTAVVSESVKGI